MTGMARLNTCARMLVRGIIGTRRCETYLAPVERFLLDNYDDRPLRDVAREHGIPETTLRQMISHVQSEMKAICAAENVKPSMLLASPEDPDA